MGASREKVGQFRVCGRGGARHHVITSEHGGGAPKGAWERDGSYRVSICTCMRIHRAIVILLSFQFFVVYQGHKIFPRI